METPPLDDLSLLTTNKVSVLKSKKTQHMYMQYKFTCFLIRIADNQLFQVISIICFPGLHDDDNRLID